MKRINKARKKGITVVCRSNQVYFRIRLHERDIIFALSNITNHAPFCSPSVFIGDEAVKVGKSNLLMDAIFFIQDWACGSDGGRVDGYFSAILIQFSHKVARDFCRRETKIRRCGNPYVVAEWRDGSLDQVQIIELRVTLRYDASSILPGSNISIAFTEYCSTIRDSSWWNDAHNE